MMGVTLSRRFQNRRMKHKKEAGTGDDSGRLSDGGHDSADSDEEDTTVGSAPADKPMFAPMKTDPY